MSTSIDPSETVQQIIHDNQFKFLTGTFYSAGDANTYQKVAPDVTQRSSLYGTLATRKD
jgi:hypothetical protein